MDEIIYPDTKQLLQLTRKMINTHTILPLQIGWDCLLECAIHPLFRRMLYCIRNLKATVSMTFSGSELGIISSYLFKLCNQNTNQTDFVDTLIEKVNKAVFDFISNDLLCTVKQTKYFKIKVEKYSL